MSSNQPSSVEPMVRTAMITQQYPSHQTKPSLHYPTTLMPDSAIPVLLRRRMISTLCADSEKTRLLLPEPRWRAAVRFVGAFLLPSVLAFGQNLNAP